MNDAVVKSRPRVEEERQRRRRRDDMGDGRLRNLSVPGTLDPNFEYRWINDDVGRVHALTVDDDWNVVSEADLGIRSEKDRQVGSGVIERVRDKQSGKRAILVRKAKDWYESDRAKVQRNLDELDTMIKQGQVPAATPDMEPRRNGVNAYVPAGGISIQDGRKN